MTSPDDLARHRAYVPHYGNGWVACSCGEGEDNSGFDYNAHLASIVSRLDADLRTRIEGLCARGLDDDRRNAARDALAEIRDLVAVPRCQHVSPSPWGPTQCALAADHSGRHAYSPSESEQR